MTNKAHPVVNGFDEFFHLTTLNVCDYLTVGYFLPVSVQWMRRVSNHFVV